MAEQAEPRVATPAVPSGGPLFQPPGEAKYITWEQDFAGMNNVRLQVCVVRNVVRQTLR